MPLAPAQNKARVTVSVDGVDLGSFQTKAGGQTTGEALKTRPGGGEDEISIASTKSRDTVTVAKLYDDAMKANRVWLDGRVNRGRGVVSDQPLDADDNPYGTPDVYRGILVRFTPPDRDANASEDARCELEFSIDGIA